jgi:alpha-1,2-mannosyltransferase
MVRADLRRAVAALTATLVAVALLAWVLAAWAPVDLIAYRSAAMRVGSGLPLYLTTTSPAVDGIDLPFTYPPFAALLFLPLSWVPQALAIDVWTVASLAALVGLSALSFEQLLRRLPRLAALAVVAALVGAALVTLPVSDHLRLGQIDLFLALACLWDVRDVGSRRRGVLVGLSAAVKLTPALFIVHFAMTRQWRAAVTASLTTLGCWVLAAVALPSDTFDYFRNGLLADVSRVDAEGTFLTDQSLRAVVERSGLAPVVWFGAVAVVVIVGLARSARAHLQGDELAAATLVGVTALAVSPVSWLHHGIWIVPVLGVIVGDGRRPRRVVVAAGAWLVACLLPVSEAAAYAMRNHGTVDPAWMWPFRNGFALLYLAVVFWLPLRPMEGVGDPESETAA